MALASAHSDTVVLELEERWRENGPCTFLALDENQVAEDGENGFTLSYTRCQSPVYDIIYVLPGSPREDALDDVQSDCHTDSDNTTVPSNSRQSHEHEPMTEADMALLGECVGAETDAPLRTPSTSSSPGRPIVSNKSPKQLPPLDHANNARKDKGQSPPRRSEQRQVPVVQRQVPVVQICTKAEEKASSLLVLTALPTSPAKSKNLSRNPCTSSFSASNPPPTALIGDDELSALLKDPTQPSVLTLHDLKRHARGLMLRKAASEGRLFRGPTPMVRTGTYTPSDLPPRANSHRRVTTSGNGAVRVLPRTPSAAKPLEPLEHFGSAGASLLRSERTAEAVLLKLHRTRTAAHYHRPAQ